MAVIHGGYDPNHLHLSWDDPPMQVFTEPKSIQGHFLNVGDFKFLLPTKNMPALKIPRIEVLGVYRSEGLVFP